MSIEEAMEKTPASHFFIWIEFLQREDEKTTVDHWYLAQIAREVHCVLMKSSQRKQVKVKDFIVKFKKQERKEARKKIEYDYDEDEWIDPVGDDEERMVELKKKTEVSKSYWFALCGVKAEPKWEGSILNGTSHGS